MMQGKSGLAYVGVNALTPPDVTYKDRAPTFNDYMGYDLMHLWHVILPTTPTSYELWYLANKASGYATWIRMYPQGGGGGGDLRSDDGLDSTPTAGHINVRGGNAYVPGSDIRLGDPNYVNIYTVQFPDVNTLEVVLKRSINQPNTNATATEGMYSLEGLNFMHNYGTNNTFLGHSSGNLGLDPVVASLNTGIGKNALHALQNGSRNTAIGASCMLQTDDGVYNVGIGYNTGSACAGTDSSLILISNVGVNGESNTIRIGTMPVPPYDAFGVPTVPGAGEQNACYVAGIWNGVAIPAKDTGLVIVDEDGKLYVDNIAPDSVIMTNATGNPIAVKGPKGTVLTGRGLGAGDPAPTFLELKSAGGTVGITVTPGGPDVDCINLEVLPAAGGVATLTTDTGIVLPLLANINVLGGELINTDNLVANTVTVNLDRGADGTVVAGTGAGSAAIYKTLFSPDGSIVFDFVTDPTAIHMVAPGGGGGGVTNLTADSGVQALPVGGAIQIAGGLNIRTVGSNPPGVITVHVTDDVDLAGHLYATTDIKTSTGNLVSTAGNLILPNTDGAGTMGAIRFGAGLGTRWIHNYGTNNIFIGPLAGNNTLTVADAVGNIGIGRVSSTSITTGSYNTACGYASNYLLTTGDYNSAFGCYALKNLLTGSYNVALGHNSGSAYTGAEHGNICISSIGALNDAHQLRLGTHGTGDQQQSDCYIAGIRDAAAGTSPEMVVIGTIASGYKVWSQAIPDAGATVYRTDSGDAAPAVGVIQIKGGYNVGTRAAGNIVYVDVDNSIQQDITAVDGSTGVYALGTRGANTYSANRFLHAWGGGLGMTGYNTFVGYQNGRLNAGAIGTNNTILGALAFDAYTSASNCVAIGKNALGAAITGGSNVSIGASSGAALTTGSANIFLGTSSGTAYTTESNNITLGHAGVAADARTMRLGFNTQWDYVVDKTNPDGVFTQTVVGVNNTYIYGIYNSSLDSSALPVYVDKAGKVGTSGGCMFAYRQTTALPSVTGDGSVYSFGTSGGITVDFDLTNSLSYVGAVGASNFVFTAPYPGKYVFTGTITMVIPASPPVPRTTSRDPLWLVTSGLDFIFCNYIPPSTTTVQYVSEIVTAIVYLDRYDTARWACSCGVAGQVKNISIAADVGVSPVPTGVTYAYGTHFYGYRIA